MTSSRQHTLVPSEAVNTAHILAILGTLISPTSLKPHPPSLPFRSPQVQPRTSESGALRGGSWWAGA